MKQVTVVYVTETLKLGSNGGPTVAQSEPDENPVGARFKEVDTVGQVAPGVATVRLRHGTLPCRGHRDSFAALRGVVEKTLRFAERFQSRRSGRIPPRDVLQPEPVVIEWHTSC
ncbi:hypothetical protein [Streptomyces sp. enrichment culture]|uniref:hypothetical protein n=1 Tax=Streptomyces sp. enrichment culture TaxID=1795815 RepID=UPI003F54F96C